MTKQEWILMAAAHLDFSNMERTEYVPNGPCVPTHIQLRVVDLIPKLLSKVEQTADLLEQKGYFGSTPMGYDKIYSQ